MPMAHRPTCTGSSVGKVAWPTLHHVSPSALQKASTRSPRRCQPQRDLRARQVAPPPDAIYPVQAALQEQFTRTAAPPVEQQVVVGIAPEQQAAHGRTVIVCCSADRLRDEIAGDRAHQARRAVVDPVKIAAVRRLKDQPAGPTTARDRGAVAQRILPLPTRGQPLRHRSAGKLRRVTGRPSGSGFQLRSQSRLEVPLQPGWAGDPRLLAAPAERTELVSVRTSRLETA